MEEEEDFTIDDEGRLDLRYRGWTEVDSGCFNLLNQISILDISFNQLQTLPDEIGMLKMVTNLNCACNALQSIPSAIGRLRRLKILNLTGNRLNSLPDDIGKCHRLSTIYLNENRVDELPASLGQCISLKELHLDNNVLTSLPLDLAKVRETLEVVSVRNNPTLSIIPTKMHGNSRVIIWIICFLYEQGILIDTIQSSSLEMTTLANQNKFTIGENKKQIQGLEEEIKLLREERESVQYYLRLREQWRKSRMKWQKFRSFVNTMMSRESKIAIRVIPDEEEW